MIYLSVFSGIVLTLLIGLTVFSAVKFSESLKDMISHADRLHANSLQTLEGILDRFMAVDFSEYKLAQLTVQAQEGYQEFPETPEEVVQELEFPGTEAEKEARMNEARILAEDFPAVP